ncbi:MAG: FUSC family protein [Microthrixaceae bacterium]
MLRSGVLDTGSSALQSILGTIGGFAVASAVILAVGDSRTALAILFPLAVFAAGYSRCRRVRDRPGAFTAMVVVLFNLSSPSVGHWVSFASSGLHWVLPFRFSWHYWSCGPEELPPVCTQ